MLTIGFAGNLQSWEPDQKRRSALVRTLKEWFWLYQPRNVDFSTRSGYFLFRGLERFGEKYPELRKSIQVCLWGRIRPLNQRQVEEFGLSDMVEIEGFLPRSTSFEKLSACDVLFLPLESPHDGQRPLFIPGKLYEYLKTGKPVLALAGDSDCVDILLESGLGVVCSPFDSEKIADTLAFLVRNREELPSLYRPNQDVIDRYSFERIVSDLARTFDDVLGRS